MREKNAIRNSNYLTCVQLTRQLLFIEFCVKPKKTKTNKKTVIIFFICSLGKGKKWLYKLPLL